MVQINFAQKQVNAKVVYYGPGMSGKTTNLEVVHQRAPSQNRGDLTSISTDGDRTLFFDFMPLDLGTVAGMRTCFQIYTVPGQVYYNSTRKLVLQGVDGVVFVADSSAAMIEENLESLRNLEQNLNEYGKSLATVAHVIQFNKRDLPDAMTLDELNRLLNPHNAPFYEAIANTGQGVFPTLKALAARVLETIHNNGGRGGQQPAAPIPTAAPMAAPQAQPAFAQAPVMAAKTGFNTAPSASPQAVVAAQRALQQTGFHAAVQAQQRGGGMPPPLGAPQAQPPLPQMHAQPHAIPMQHGSPDLARTTVHAPPGHTPMGGGMPPSMAQGHGHAPHAQPHAAQPMMQQPLTQQPHGGGLRLASSAPAGGGLQMSGQAKRPAPNIPTTSATPRPQPKAEPRQQAAVGRPASAPQAAAPAPVAAPVAQPQPRGKSKAWVYASIFVFVALGIGVVVAKMVLKLF
jgi:hypothetical protein